MHLAPSRFVWGSSESFVNFIGLYRLIFAIFSLILSSILKESAAQLQHLTQPIGNCFCVSREQRVDNHNNQSSRAFGRRRIRDQR